jgi:Ca2+-binding RTX toxin-like protein
VALRSTLDAIHRYSGTLGVTDYRWFNLRDNLSTGTDLFDAVGLLRDDYSEKPAFATYRSEIEAKGADRRKRVRCAGRIATVTGTGGRDDLRGSAGPDVIATGGGRDHVAGASGNDRICTGPGRDAISGGPGRDTLVGGRAADHIRGGGGRDRCPGTGEGDHLRSCAP